VITTVRAVLASVSDAPAPTAVSAGVPCARAASPFERLQPALTAASAVSTRIERELAKEISDW
jgi:hypothetical protein